MQNPNDYVVIMDENIIAILREEGKGISARATSIARICDRLPPGKYTIELNISELKGKPWEINAYKRELIQRGEFK